MPARCLSKEIIEKLDGKIRVCSRTVSQRSGTVFVLSFPASVLGAGEYGSTGLMRTDTPLSIPSRVALERGYLLQEQTAPDEEDAFLKRRRLRLHRLCYFGARRDRRASNSLAGSPFRTNEVMKGWMSAGGDHKSVRSMIGASGNLVRTS